MTIGNPIADNYKEIQARRIAIGGDPWPPNKVEEDWRTKYAWMDEYRRERERLDKCGLSF